MVDAATATTDSAVSWETSTRVSPFSNTTSSSVVIVSAEAAVAAARNDAPRSSVNPPLRIADASDVCTFDLPHSRTESRPRAAPLEFDFLQDSAGLPCSTTALSATSAGDGL